jgi:hypothetical protein
MAYTGGELNSLNGKYGISAPYKSVPVMKLIKEHKPKSKDELLELIKFHYENDCDCGIKSQGTIESFGQNLYNAQQQEWGEYRHSLQDCIQWEYDLFVIQPLKGTLIEDKALSELQVLLPKLFIEKAEGYVDEELRVDLIVSNVDGDICGIQVKPETFNYMRESVISFNKTANAKWGKPVYYLFYDSEEKFSNIDELIEDVNKITLKN